MNDEMLTDEMAFKMFDKWPCNTFKPKSHIGSKSNEMRVVGSGVLESYKGVVTPRKNDGDWEVTLSDGAVWAYSSLVEMLADWRIARTDEEYRR